MTSIHPTTKTELHPRSLHRERYDFKALIKDCPGLAAFVRENDYGDESIDFFNPDAVRMLNKALLKHHYQIDNWEIPAQYLCPPIPGRADYIHYVADLLSENPQKNKAIKCLDIGVGANCIYPLIGNRTYDWQFVASDIDPIAIQNGQQILKANPAIAQQVELRIQKNDRDVLVGIIQPNDKFDLVICNPPFHRSYADSQAGTRRKVENLKQKQVLNPVLNFGGKSKELWCEGGELKFIKTMMLQSKEFSNQCEWFTAIVSKKDHLAQLEQTLFNIKATKTKIIQMGQGQKTSRIIAWSFK
jgi:23S rRNA (adenine1618-N6)-methyltransferase